MALATRFEELVVWRKARALTSDIYTATGTVPFRRDRDLQSQMRRAAVSIVSNVAEGFERNSKADFARFLLIAKGSCGELRAQLYVALDQGYLDQPGFDELFARSIEVIRLLAALRASILAPRGTA